jgi:hypothetical protein
MPIAPRGRHERTAGVPNCREPVTQDRFRRHLPEQKMGMQVDEARKQRAGKADERARAGETVGRCHGFDPITRHGDRVALEQSGAIEDPIRGHDVLVTESPRYRLARGGPGVRLVCHGFSLRRGLLL